MTTCRPHWNHFAHALLLALCWSCDGGDSTEPGPSPEVAPQEGLDQDALRDLQRLGYTGGGEAVAESGVTLGADGPAARRLHLYCSGHGPEAVLIDGAGHEWHRWRCEARTAWPELPGEIPPEYDSFRRVALLPDGHLLAIFEGVGLVKLDRDSNVVWARQNGAHHDLEVQDDGRILVLTRTAHVVPRVHPTRPILEDSISLLEPDGTELRRVSLLTCMERAGIQLRFPPGQFDPDPFHTNTLQVMDGSLGDHPALQPGIVLVSLRNLHRLVWIDLAQEKVVHSMAGDFRRQHEPSMLANGQVLLFDNLGAGPGRSRVLELTFPEGQVAWSYGARPEQPLFSELCGTSVRLPHGNTLIAESGRGRALEVTPDGDVVWEFYNPHRFGPDGVQIAELFDLVRLPEDFPVAWTRRAQEGR